MGKTIKVCVRTRPTAQFAAGHIAIDADRNAITIDKGHEASPDGVCNNAQSRFDFRFHHVLHNASQDTVYETLARDVALLAATHDVSRLAAFDQFPYTHHLEAGVVLERKS